MRNPMKLFVENPVKLFVDNPIKLFIYSTIVGNKQVLKLVVKVFNEINE